LFRRCFFDPFNCSVALWLSCRTLCCSSSGRTTAGEAPHHRGNLRAWIADWDSARGLAWSPDGKHLTFMAFGDLSEIEPGSDDAYIIVNRSRLASFNGASASETDRDHRERYRMASYLWSPDSTHLLFDANGRLWLYDLHNRAGVQVGSSGAASGDDPSFRRTANLSRSFASMGWRWCD